MGGTIALYEYMWTGVKVLQCCLSTAMCVRVLQCELIVQSTRSLGSLSRAPWQKRLTTFSTGFSMDFACGKMAGKVANGGHVTAGHFDCHKYELVAKYPYCNCMTMECCHDQNF